MRTLIIGILVLPLVVSAQDPAATQNNTAAQNTPTVAPPKSAAQDTAAPSNAAQNSPAQDPAAEKPMTFGGFENQGSVTFGYRFTDVAGYKPKYEELFNLKSGPRLLDFSWFGKAQEGKNNFADDYSLTMSGLGGDPFSAVQVTARKSKLYDLRANFRQSYYYWNRNDSAVLPNGFNGLTNNHAWATVRKLGSVNLLIHASNNLKFNLEYYRNTRDGVTDTTRSLDYFGSSTTWGSFARANPYYFVAPVNESANRFTGGIDYTHRSWTFHYKLGYQSFSDAVHLDLATSPERSLNIDDVNTAKELANGASWSDFRKLNTPVSEFSYTGKLTSTVDARGSYIFYRFSGPASLDASFDGTGRTVNATTFAPYVVSMSSRANNTEPNHVIDQGFSYRIKEWWTAMVDYRYSRFTVDSTAQFRSVNGTAIVTGTSLDQWRIGTSTLDFNMVLTPVASLLVRAGIRLMKSDVEFLQDHALDLTRTKRIKTAWPTASVYYQPSRILTVRADVEQTTNGTSYTRVTPHTDVGGRFIVRVRPTEKFYIEDTAIVRNRTLLQTGFHSAIRSNAATLNYDFDPRLTVFAGFSYTSFYASSLVDFLRGTAPFTDVFLQDQTVDRVWQGGLKAEPVKGLGITFTGNFVRTTGVGQIAGETPLYGPMSFPYATGSIYYDFPRLGRMMVQLQRTYYTEQIVPGNNFSANLLTLAWTRTF